MSLLYANNASLCLVIVQLVNVKNDLLIINFTLYNRAIKFTEHVLNFVYAVVGHKVIYPFFMQKLRSRASCLENVYGYACKNAFCATYQMHVITNKVSCMLI